MAAGGRAGEREHWATGCSGLREAGDVLTRENPDSSHLLSPPVLQLISGTVKNEKADPRLHLKNDDRITLEGSTKEKKNNLSILLRDLDFGDTGRYTCHVRNPKEKDLQHQATIFLQVVHKCTPWAGRGVGGQAPHEF